jgi:quercetin dioxygenase-like cupin family protein
VIHAGDTIENPVTGERLVFRKTSAETNGEAVVLECFVQPTGFVATAHVHPGQDERFEVLKGKVGFKLDGQEIVAHAGDRIRVPAGTSYRFWNAGDEEAHFVCEVRPALQFEQLIETMFGLAADGKTNRKGMPNPLRLAVIANDHFDTVRLPFLRRSCNGSGSRSERPWGGYSATGRHTFPRWRRARDQRRGMRRFTLRQRLYLAVAVMGLLVLALAGMVVRWAGSFRPAQGPPRMPADRHNTARVRAPVGRALTPRTCRHDDRASPLTMRGQAPSGLDLEPDSAGSSIASTSVFVSEETVT